MAVSSSVGFFGYIGVPVTPIIIEVIPFLVLAIGVDNLFIIVHTYDRLVDEDDEENIPDKAGRMLSIVGPSVTLTSLSECCCFFVGNDFLYACALKNIESLKLVKAFQHNLFFLNCRSSN